MADVIDILRDLVAFNTVSTEPTTAAVDYVRRFLEELGFSSLVIGDDRFQNLIARNGVALEYDRRGEPYFALCAHIDTVPFDREQWSSDPLVLKEKEGALHGIGSADMKGPLACMLQSMARTSRESPSAPLALVLTHHEETALEGADELYRSAEAREAMRCMQLIIGEPTGLSLGYAHKGVLDFTITIQGRAAHSVRLHEGLNAIYAAAEVAQTVRTFSRRLLQQEADGFECGDTVNLGTFHAGDIRNRVAPVAVLSGDLRFLPGSSVAGFLEEVARQFRFLEADGYRCELKRDHEVKPFLMPRDRGLIAELSALLATPPITLGYATDASVFQGLAGIDCAIIGPGEIAVCHRPDEHIRLSELERGIEAYTQILSSRCRRGAAPARAARR